MRVVFQLLVIIVAGLLSFGYYGLVMPDRVAVIMGLIIAGYMALNAIFGRMDLSQILVGGATIMVWPAGTFLATWVGQLFGVALTDAQSMAAAPLLAALAGLMAYSYADKRDRARDMATMSISIIVLYTLFAAIASGDHWAKVIACISVAAGGFVIKQVLVVPPMQEKALYAVICMPLAGGLLAAVF